MSRFDFWIKFADFIFKYFHLRLVPALRLLIFIVVASGVGSNSNETSILDAGDDHSIAQYREKMVRAEFQCSCDNSFWLDLPRFQCVMRGRKCNRNRPCCSGICKRGKCRADLTSYANSTQLGSSLDNCAQVLADCRSICAPNKALITCDPKPPCCFCQLPCSVRIGPNLLNLFESTIGFLNISRVHHLCGGVIPLTTSVGTTADT